MTKCDTDLAKQNTMTHIGLVHHKAGLKKLLNDLM